MQFLVEQPSQLYKPQYVVFSDFDETYLAHDLNQARLRAVQRLEAFIRNQSCQLGVLFGWVTGSNLESVRAKMDSSGLRLMPHFVGSALGT